MTSCSTAPRWSSVPTDRAGCAREAGWWPGRVSSSAHTALPVAVWLTPHLSARASMITKPYPDSSSPSGVPGCGRCGSASWTSIRREVPAASSRRISMDPPQAACRTALVTSSETKRSAVSSRWATRQEASTSRVACRASAGACSAAGSDISQAQRESPSMPGPRGQLELAASSHISLCPHSRYRRRSGVFHGGYGAGALACPPAGASPDGAPGACGRVIFTVPSTFDSPTCS